MRLDADPGRTMTSVGECPSGKVRMAPVQEAGSANALEQHSSGQQVSAGRKPRKLAKQGVTTSSKRKPPPPAPPKVNDEGYTPLMEAAQEGYLDDIKYLLKHGAKINAQTEETHETALTLAAYGGFLDVVDTLYNEGADIDLGASTPLMEASQEGHYPVVKYLLHRGADITKQTQTGDTALSYACENGHVDVVELLVQKGADPEHLSEDGRTPLMHACRGGHLDVIKYLLGKGADVNRQTASNDHTPLSLACAGGHIAAFEVLLAAGANPFHKLRDGSTMIIEAARGGHTSVMRALLDYPPRDKQQSQGPAPSGTSKQPQLKATPIPASSTKGQSHSVASTQTTPTAADQSSNARALDVDSATESNGETSLSIAAASGHHEVVEFLIGRKAHIEHRDKKGYTPLILATDGGHEKVVELLLNNCADIEAQSEGTKDTALSLACTKGRFEVVELLLKRGANKERRNVSDYTPLSLAASRGNVNIIKLLLTHGAEINARTGSKAGITPLMLAAMNGQTEAVKLLLDMGSDINAQIEMTKNTALTLACRKGRQEVVQLLLERKANLEHRAQTGLTPLMEAANGGYELGEFLIEKGAEVNAAVPATRDTALTIAAGKGHYRFVELLLNKGAIVDARNKKGCTPLWLACHGGHLGVGLILFRHRADLDSQDNRKISCLMAAFRNGHVKVIRWIVKIVQQFPSDQEMTRYIIGLQNEPDLLKRCQQCAEYIKQAKDKQALEANKKAAILLEELDMEKGRKESKQLAAQRRREKKTNKKKAKKQQVFGGGDDGDNQPRRRGGFDDDDDEDDEEIVVEVIDSRIDANSQGSNFSATQGDSSKRRGNQSNKGKGKENQQQKHQPPPPVPPQKSASSKSVSSSASAATPPIPDVTDEPQTSTKQTPPKSSRKKKNKSRKNNAINSNIAENKVESENNNEGLKNISNSISTSKSISKENQTSKAAPVGGNFVSSKASTTKSSSAGDNVVRENVEVDIGTGNKSSSNKKDKKNREESEQGVSKKTKDVVAEAAHLRGDFHLASNKLSASNASSAMSQGMSGASVNKKMKGGLETVPVAEPLMGISLSPSQLKKGNGGSTANAASYPSSTDHESSHPAFTSPGSVSSSSVPTRMKTAGAGAATGGKSVPGAGARKGDDGWKEVTRNCPSSRSKKVIVPSSVISRVIGRGGCNINAIREATGAHIEVEKQQKGQVQPERTIQIKGSADATKQAHTLITALMNEPDIDVKKLLPLSARSSNSTSSTAGAPVTPTPSSVGQFPVIGSVTSLLQQQVATTMVAQSSSNVTPTLPGHQQSSTRTGGNSSNMSTPVDIIIPQATGGTPGGNKPGTFGGKGVKGSPNTQRTVLVSGSPPLASMKSGSPPIKKPVVVSSQSQRGSSMGGNKRSGGGGGIGTFAAKLVQPHQQQHRMSQSQHQPDSQTWDNRQMTQSASNATPTPIGAQTKRMTPTAGIMVAAPATHEGMIPTDQHQAQYQAPRYLAPGSHPNPSATAPGSSSAPGGNRSSLNMDNHHQHQQQRVPLEYSPFNYTFSKTAGWYPGDLAVNSTTPSGGGNVPGGTGMHGALSGSSTSLNSSVARAMNYASVAASGISTSTLSTSQAQMSQAGGMHANGNCSSQAAAAALGITSGSMSVGKSGEVDPGEGPKVTADVSKAPGYRGSPTLRQIQQQPPSSSMQNNPGAPFGTSMMDGPLSSTFVAAAGITTGLSGMVNFGNTPGPGAVAVGPPGQQKPQQVQQYGVQHQQQHPYGQDLNVMNQQQMLFSNNRLNPRAPSFNLHMGKVSSPVQLRTPGNQQNIFSGPNNPPNSMAFHHQQQNQFGSGLHQQMGQQHQFKGMGNQYPGMNRGGTGSRAVGGFGSAPNHGGAGGAAVGWNAYNNEDLLSFPGFAALASSAGMVDGIGGIISGMEAMGADFPVVAPPGPLKMDDRRQQPRPIGGERAWKQSSNSGGSEGASGLGAALQGFAVSPWDCIDAGPLPHSMHIRL